MGRYGLVCLLALGACDPPTSECRQRADCGEGERCLVAHDLDAGRCIPTPEYGEVAPPMRHFDAGIPFDILFVIDDGPTMAEPQRRMVAGIATFVDQLAWTHTPTRVAVTTTSVDSPVCDSPGPVRHGQLAATSCLDRLEHFIGPDGTDARTLCTETCRWSTEDLGLDQRPWLDADDLPPGVPLSEALACLLPQGIAGCEHGGPLEAAHLAGLRFAEPRDAAYGFVREGLPTFAIVTDGVDCSATPEAGPAFDPLGARTLWPDGPYEAAPGAVCLRAGTRCSDDPDDPDDPDGPICEVADRTPDGWLATHADPTILHRQDRYDGPRWWVNYFVVAGLAPPADGAAPPPSRLDPAFVAEQGAAPGCDDGTVRAVPPVRLAAVADHTASICDADYGGWMARLANTSFDNTMCLPRCLQTVLRVRFEAEGSDPVSIPECLGSDPHRHVPDGAPACASWRDNPTCRRDTVELLMKRASAADTGGFLLDPSPRFRVSPDGTCR
jgi:hypothetical protein